MRNGKKRFALVAGLFLGWLVVGPGLESGWAQRFGGSVHYGGVAARGVAVGPRGGVVGGTRGVAVTPGGVVVGGAHGVAVGPNRGVVGGSVRYAGVPGGYAYRRVNVATLPAGYRTFAWQGNNYCWYRGLPVGYRPVVVNGATYYTANNVWYYPYIYEGEQGYVVMDDPNFP